MLKQHFDAEKALEVILYIAERCQIKDIYHVLKIQFFADRKHLERNGRFITGDSYIAMKNGPVASNAYDFLKIARNGAGLYAPALAEQINNALQVKGNYQISVKRCANMDYLSASDVACLDESIAENGALSFQQINDKSHDDLWRAADKNSEITLESFVAHSKNKHLSGYLNLDD